MLIVQAKIVIIHAEKLFHTINKCKRKVLINESTFPFPMACQNITIYSGSIKIGTFVENSSAVV